MMKKTATVSELLNILLASPLEHVTIAEARKQFKDILEKSAKNHVLITHHGKPQAALIDYEAFQAVQQLVLRLAQRELAPEPEMKFEVGYDNPEEAELAAREAVKHTRNCRHDRSIAAG